MMPYCGRKVAIAHERLPGLDRPPVEAYMLVSHQGLHAAPRLVLLSVMQSMEFYPGGA